MSYPSDNTLRNFYKALQWPISFISLKKIIHSQKLVEVPIKEIKYSTLTTNSTYDKASIVYHKQQIERGNEEALLGITTASGDLTIIDGRHRLAAYKQLHHKVVPIVIII